MYGNRGDADLAGSLVGIALLLAIAAGIVIATTLLILLTEIGRIYQARAFQPGRAARILWFSLVSALGIWLLAGVLISGETTRPEGLYVGAWSFLFFTLIAVGVDWSQRQHDPVEVPLVPAEVTIEDLLAGSWKEQDAA